MIEESFAGHGAGMRKSVLVMTLGIAGFVTAPTSSGADISASDIATLQASDPSLTVQSLYQHCTASAIHELMFCAGYFTSSIDNMMVLGADVSTHAYGICPKTAISAGAATQAFKNWAQGHPEAWGIQRYLGVLWAMQAVWPCK
jgi:hypothetical protein